MDFNMLFNNISEMNSYGFLGFEEIQYLMNNNCENVPERKGVYFVLKDSIHSEFLDRSVGGHFKGKDPTVDLQKLKSKWVDDTLVVYIGQAGGGDSKETLFDRLKTYMSFGRGNPVAHWGGRYIWQLQNSRKLKVCWKTIPNFDPEVIEKNLIKEFENHYGKKPFANIRS